MAENTFSFKQRVQLAVLPRLIAGALRLLAATWRVRHNCPWAMDPKFTRDPYIYAFWHEGVVTIIGYWRDQRIHGLASMSFDGELIAKTMAHLGYPPLARGSSSRGGAAALEFQRDVLNKGEHVAITVDGPRGPAYEPKLGAVRLSVMTKTKVVPVGSACWPDWRLRSWDRTQLPPPFARVAYVFGEPVLVQSGQEDLMNRQLKLSLDEAVHKAQVWARTGKEWVPTPKMVAETKSYAKK